MKSIKNYSPIGTTVNEVILLPGSHFEVVGHMSPTESLHIIHVKQLKSSNIKLISSPLEVEKMSVTTMSLEFNDPSILEVDEVEPTTKIRTLIKKFRGKTNWWLRNPKLTDNDIQELTNVLKADQTCRTLDLSYNNLSTIAAYHLADLLSTDVTLKQLHITHSQIGDEGAQAVFEVLKYRNKTLTDIGLLHSQISDQNVESILEIINLNQTLTDIHLGGNEISQESQQRLTNNTAALKLRVDFTY